MSHCLKLLSYNIHQGITARRHRLGLAALREAIASLQPDVLALQEVAGVAPEGSARSAPELCPGEIEEQVEALCATGLWPYQAYGRNARFAFRCHGNAVLSRFPITAWNNTDISVDGRERRGLLHAEIQVPAWGQRVHVLGVHFGLRHGERRRQTSHLCRYVDERLEGGGPVLLAGDFNDWRGALAAELRTFLGLREAMAARTYPSRFPLFGLDRIYYRGLPLRESRCLTGHPWRRLSDHLPLLAEFEPPALRSSLTTEDLPRGVAGSTSGPSADHSAGCVPVSGSFVGGVSVPGAVVPGAVPAVPPASGAMPLSAVPVSPVPVCPAVPGEG